MRQFLFLLSALMALGLNAQSDALMPSVYLTPEFTAAENAPARIQIAGPDEPGDRVVISGQVVYGNTPIAGASVFVFHTDANGEYAPGISGPDAELAPRLFGALRTDANGRYRVETIMPGSYDNNPAHVHYLVKAPGYLPRIFDLWFQDDPLLVARREAGEPQVQQSMRNSPYYKVAPDLIAIRPVTIDNDATRHVVRNLDMIPE